MLLIKVLSTAGAISRFRINRDNSTAVVKCSGSGSLKIRVDMFLAVFSDGAKGVEVVSGLGRFLGIQGY